MLRTMLWISLVLGSSVQLASGQESDKPAKVTVMIRGVVNEQDAAALRAVLTKLPAIKFDADEIEPGERGRFGHYFSPPFVVQLENLETTDVGGMAKAVSDTQTRSRGEIEPSLYLVFFHLDGRIGEEDVEEFRQVLVDVNGLEVQQAGGVGGSPQDGRMWVRLEAAGGANLPLILDAVRRNNLKVATERP